MPPANSSPVLDAERRAWSYWFVDGLPNLVAGLISLLLAVAFVLLSHQRHNKSLVLFASAAILTLVYILVFARFRQTIEWLKARITYPRTGYAAPPTFTSTLSEPLPADVVMLNLGRSTRPGILPDTEEMIAANQERRWWVMIALIIYAAAFLSAAFVHQPWICGVLGVIASLGTWMMTRKNERASWALAFGLPYAGMFIFTIAGPYNKHLRVDRLGFFLAGAGLMLAATGAVALVRYLKHNPVARA